MMEIHRAARRNDIDRDGKKHRGYSNVRFIDQPFGDGGES